MVSVSVQPVGLVKLGGVNGIEIGLEPQIISHSDSIVTDAAVAACTIV